MVIPWKGNMVFLAKMMPIGFQDRFGKAIGLHNQMSDFKGKGAMDKRIPGLNNGGH